ncbi:flagellar protein FliT [Lachnospiraceae bacterium]|nr:flagellar protein FliT [Lachnospiraceae bacterium]
MENYLQVLEESLHKKLDVLNRIEKLCSRQEEILSAASVSEDDFDSSIEEKGILIDELSKLDEGFESLYTHIKEQLALEKGKYTAQIAILQRKIAEVTEKSVAIQAQEARNKRLAEVFFANAKQELKKGRRSSKAALDYYRSMNKSQMMSPQFMDKKK